MADEYTTTAGTSGELDVSADAVGSAVEPGGLYIVLEVMDEHGEQSGTVRIPVDQFGGLIEDSIDSAIANQMACFEDAPSSVAVGEVAENVNYLYHVGIVLVFVCFAVLGSICVYTLVRSFERK